MLASSLPRSARSPSKWSRNPFESTSGSEGRKTSKGTSGMVSQLRALRTSSFCIQQGDDWFERPQLGSGTPQDQHLNVIASVVKLARQRDRGETPQLSLIMQCLDDVRGLELSAATGDSGLWTLAPVLQTVLDQLQILGEERIKLEEETLAARSRMEQVSMTVEHEREWLRRATEEQWERCRQRRENTKQLDKESERLEVQLERVTSESTALRREADEGLEIERTAWKQEQIRLEVEITKYQAELEELEEVVGVEEEYAAEKAKLEGMNKKLAELQPLVDQQYELAKRVDDRENRIAELRFELEELERLAEERKNRKKKGKKKKNAD